MCFSWTVILVAHFLQSVSSGLVLGGELVYHRGRAEEGGILTLAGQYSSEMLFLLMNLPRISYFNRAGIISPLLSFDLATVGVVGGCSVSSCRTKLGGNIECWQRRCPCKLLSQSQQTGTASATHNRKHHLP